MREKPSLELCPFERGDVVQLKSGGPTMTVSRTEFSEDLEDIEVECWWFVGTKREKAVYPPETLKKAPA